MPKRDEKTFVRKVSVVLTPEQRDEIDGQIVALDKEIILIEKAKKDDNSKYRERLNTKKAEHKALLKATETGTIEREIEVYERVDERRGHMDYVEAT